MYAGYSPSYRREAGSYGKDTRGIFRVHWFDKVEMFVYCAPEEAEAMHAKLLGFEEGVPLHVGIPFRVIDVAAGDLGASAARKFDCEGWVPTQGKYARSPRPRTAPSSRGPPPRRPAARRGTGRVPSPR